MPVYFGTDGIRGVAGEFPLTSEALRMLGASLGRLLISRTESPSIVIGRDTRQSGKWMEASVSAGLRESGCNVTSAGVITTPGLAYVTAKCSFCAGIVISASHNPFTDNGLKIFLPTGEKLPASDEQEIEAVLFGTVPNEPSVYPELQEDKELSLCYTKRLMEIAEGLDLSNMKIGIDCANGAATAIAPPIFELLGAELYKVGCEPDGRNINLNCGSLHLGALSRLVQEHNLALGIAFDGDADRVLMVDHTGSVVDGDRLMLILAKYLKMLGRLNSDTVVATVMSNFGLEQALAKHGLQMLRVAVGDKYVLETLRNRHLSLGGEQSGHIIIPSIGWAGDGIASAVLILKALKTFGMDLKEATAEFVSSPQILINVPVARKVEFTELPKVMDAVADAERQLCTTGRVLLRYSGTELLARVMLEGEDATLIKSLAEHIAETIRQEIG